jgi:predicted tellurium resistance membrane protein TerC
MELDFSVLLTGTGIAAFLTLTLLEIVLGIDNIIFISVLVDRVEESKQKMTRFVGLALAMIFRIALLFSVSFLLKFQEPLFRLAEIDFSLKDLIMLTGGLFLIYKSVTEIHHKMQRADGSMDKKEGSVKVTIMAALSQIVMLDLIFSLDSILTAIGMTEDLSIMILAVVASILVMMLLMNKIANFINKNPTVLMLALSFLIMAGTMLVAEGVHVHVNKGFVYFALAFSLIVEVLNLRYKNKIKDDPGLG